jgi:hypothetical protein
MPDGEPRMVFLGFGKYARADRIYALEPIRGEERGGGKRTRVWVDGVPEAIVASRTERSILLEMGQQNALATPLLEDALAFAQRVASDADRVGPLLRRSIKAEARMDLDDLQRRARRLLETSTGAATPPEGETLFEEA